MKQDAILVLTVLVAMSGGALAQSAGRGQPQVSPRVTPLGTQRLPKPAAKPEALPERLDRVLDRALASSGGKQAIGAVRDSVSTGTVTWFDLAGAAVSFPITLTRKGDGKVQLVVQQPGGDVTLGSDGVEAWNSWNGFSVKVEGVGLGFIESQSVRSPKNLWDVEGKGSVLRDLGVRKGKGPEESRVVEVEDKQGRKTSYVIDLATSKVVGLEFTTVETRSPFGGPPSRNVETYGFSDFRGVRGVQTPHTIEHFRGGVKVEELRFTTVQHNASVKDSVFHR